MDVKFYDSRARLRALSWSLILIDKSVRLQRLPLQWRGMCRECGRRI
jgi:hypothetical protein